MKVVDRVGGNVELREDDEVDAPLIGLAGESRTFDANGQWFRVALNGGQFATPGQQGQFLLSDRPILGANPPKPAKRSPLRPEVPCETQEQPDLRTREGKPEGTFKVKAAPVDAESKAREIATTWLKGELIKTGRFKDVKVSDEPILKSELPLIGKGNR